MPINSKYCSYDPVKKVWSGRKFTPIYNTEANLGYLILQKLIQSPQNVFQISDDSGIELTNLDIYKRSIKFANFLTKCGLKQGDVVGLNASNSENLSSIIFACFILGIAVNPLATIMDVNDICYMWSKTKPKIIFCDGKIVENVKNAVDKMELDTKIFTMMEKVEGFVGVDEIWEAESDDVEDFEFPDLINISSTIALILCSSGTTASPKLICKSHKQIIINYFPLFGSNLESQDVYFINTSSYWISYSLFLIIAALYNSKVVITSQNITPELWIKIIDRHKVTNVLCPPLFGAILLKSKKLKPLLSLKNLNIAESAFSEKLVHDLMPIFPNALFQCSYGNTENNILTTIRTRRLKGASSGYPTKNVKLKIVNEHGDALGPNEPGEILCQTAAPFSGYFNDPESSKLVLDSSGFVKTGDIGYINDDGQLFVLDRIKHMQKTMNSKIGLYVIFPMQIEEVINEIDGVIQSCVVGVFDENLFYDIIYAFVIKDKSRTDLTEKFVINFVNERVIDAKRITGGVQFVEKFPLTPSGKVLNRELKKIAVEIHRHKNLKED